MATDFHPDTEQTSSAADLDYQAAEGLASPTTAPSSDGRRRQEWMMVGIGLAALVAILAIVVSIFAFASSGGSGATTTVVTHGPAATPAAAAPAKAPTLADAKGVAFEKYAKVDPTLPAVPAGAVKRFTVDVFQHVTQVDPNLAPTEAWSYAVNGKAYRGTAASPPIVVDQGDRVQITFVNGGSKTMAVNMAHSIDFHSAEVAPNKNYIDVAPGKKLTIDFVGQAPRRVHVPLRHAAGAHAHERGHDGHDGRQAAQPAAGRQGAVADPGGVLPRRPRQAGRRGQDGRRDARRHGLQRLRQPVQGAPDHRAPRREDPHVRPRRRPEQVERLPRHRHGLRHHPRRGRRRP